MTAAIFGLIGVVIGGLLSAGFQVWRERENRSRALRLAARVLFDELVWWQASLEVAIEESDPRHVTSGEAVSAAWREHRAAFADLPVKQWDRIRLGVVIPIGRRAETQASQPIEEREASDVLKSLNQRVVAALRELRELMT